MSEKKRGLLLLNLGTPQSPAPSDVGRYLREFLMDKRVIDVPFIIRWILVNILIVPRRKHASAKLYKTIWTKRGSPLLYHLEDLAQGVRAHLGSQFEVVTAMRYGEPSIQKALEQLRDKGVTDITAFPLYPQYAESSTLSSKEEVSAVAGRIDLKIPISYVPAFYQNDLYIKPFAEKIRATWEKEKPEHLLMSFHGLPERHVKKTDRSGGRHCLKTADCCLEIVDANRDCYRAQCFATARKLAMAAGIPPGKYTVSFQSRLGKDPWIKPDTEDVIRDVAAKGIKKIAVVCPAFVADCLETLEEIDVRAAELFHEQGGETCLSIPCLNSDPAWAVSVAALATDPSPRTLQPAPQAYIPQL